MAHVVSSLAKEISVQEFKQQYSLLSIQINLLVDMVLIEALFHSLRNIRDVHKGDYMLQRFIGHLEMSHCNGTLLLCYVSVFGPLNELLTTGTNKQTL